jgi:hypothetical protein
MPSATAKAKRKAQRNAAKESTQHVRSTAASAPTHISALQHIPHENSQHRSTGEKTDTGRVSMQRPPTDNGTNADVVTSRSDPTMAADMAAPSAGTDDDRARGSKVEPPIPSTGEEDDWSGKGPRGSGVHQATEYTNQGISADAMLQCENTTAGTKVWNIPTSWPREDRLRWQAMRGV